MLKWRARTSEEIPAHFEVSVSSRNRKRYRSHSCYPN